MNKKILALACFLTWGFSGQGQCLVFPNCPNTAQSVCDLSDNDPFLWNNSYWFDPNINSHNVPEGPADLSLTVVDSCGAGNIEIRYKLYLDLDQDGAWETAVRSDDLPGYNTVYFGNADSSSGAARAFDERPVMPNQKYGFALQTTAHGDSLTACVRWAAEANPDVYVIPELPYGTHKIEWTVSQNGGEQVCAYSFLVKDCKKPEVVCINNLSVNVTPTQMIVLWASDFLQYAQDNVSPFDQIQIGIRRSGAGTGFPLNPDGLPQFNVFFFCPDDLGPQMIELWARDKAGNAGFCETTVIVQDNLGICGASYLDLGICIKTVCGDKPLEEYSLDIAGGHPALPPIDLYVPIMSPDNNGCIDLPGFPFGGNYMATPKKDNDPLNGVSTFDLVLINKHILGLQPFDAPYKSLAADANNSKSVTTFDIVELRKLILGIYTELPNNTSWRFYPADFVFGSPNPLGIPVPGSDTLAQFTPFKAVKVGDVNCSAVPNSAQAPPESRSLAALDLPDMALTAGQTYELPLRVSAGAEWTGFQFALEMDPEAAGIEAVVPGTLPGLDENALAQTRPGLLTVSWFDAAARLLPDGETILTLKIRARRDVVLSEAVRLNTQRIGAEAYTGDGQIQTLQLYFAKPATGTVQIFAPRPNPTAGAASFPVRLEQAGPVELRLSDLAGKKVFQRTFNLEAGLQELAVPAAVLMAGGVYVWRVKAGGVARSGKLVRL